MATITLTNTADSASRIQARVEFELMQQWLPARAVDPREHFAAAHDQDSNPLFFSIGDDGGFYAIVRAPDTPTGWAEYRLNGGLPPAQTPSCFAMSQDADGTLHLVLATGNTAGTQAQIYVAGPLANTRATFQVDAGTNWDKWAERSLDGLQEVVDIVIGTGDDGLGSPHAVVAARKSGSVGLDTWLLETDPGVAPAAAWRPYPLPGNADTILALAPGTVGGERGVFALYSLVNAQTLEFATAPVAGMPTYYNFTLPAGAPLASIAVVRGAAAAATTDNPDCSGISNYSSDLYAAGAGVFLYPASATAAPEQIAGSDRVPDLQHDPFALKNGGSWAQAPAKRHGLVVCGSAEGAVVWVICGDNQLKYLRGPGSVGTGNWLVPMVLRENASQIAPLWNTRRATNEIFYVSGDAQLFYLWQDPGSSLWGEKQIPLADTGKALPLSSYTAHIALTSTTGTPITSTKVLINASQWCYIYSNGRAHSIDPQSTAELLTDITGVVTVILPTSRVASPVLHIQVDGFNEIIDINPSAKVQQGLLNSTGDAFKQALGSTDATDSEVDAAHKAIQQMAGASATSLDPNLGLSGVSSRTDPNATPWALDTAKLGKNWAWGATFGKDGVKVFQGSDALVMLEQIGHAVETFIGDLFAVAESAVKEAGSILLHAAENVPGLGIVVKIGEFVFKAVATGIAELMHGLNWLLNKLGFLLAKLLIWLGILPDPTQIKRTVKVLANGANAALDQMIAEIDELKDTIKGAIDTVKKQVADWGGAPPPAPTPKVSPDTSSLPSTLISTISSAMSIIQGPVSNFPVFHLLHSGLLSEEPDKKPTPTLSQEKIDAILAEIPADIEALVEQIATQISQLASQMANDELTPEQFFKELAADIAIDVLTALEDLLMIVLDLVELLIAGIKDLLNVDFNIPFLTGFVQALLDEDDFTILEALATLFAIPVNAIYKAVTGDYPFANGTYGLDTATGQDFLQLIAGRSTLLRQQTQPGPTLGGAIGDPAGAGSPDVRAGAWSSFALSSDLDASDSEVVLGSGEADLPSPTLGDAPKDMTITAPKVYSWVGGYLNGIAAVADIVLAFVAWSGAKQQQQANAAAANGGYVQMTNFSNPQPPAAPANPNQFSLGMADYFGIANNVLKLGAGVPVSQGDKVEDDLRIASFAANFIPFISLLAGRVSNNMNVRAGIDTTGSVITLVLNIAIGALEIKDENNDENRTNLARDILSGLGGLCGAIGEFPAATKNPYVMAGLAIGTVAGTGSGGVMNVVTTSIDVHDHRQHHER